MKRVYIFLFFTFFLSNQILSNQVISLVAKSSFSGIPKGTIFPITDFIPVMVTNIDGQISTKYLAKCELGNKEIYCELMDINRFCAVAKPIENQNEYWVSTMLFNKDLLKSIEKNGLQVALRNEFSDDCQEFINKLYLNNMIFEDPLLENYLNTILHKIIPKNNLFYKSGNVNIVLVKSDEINAGIYPDGTLILNVGLIASLGSEAEMAAIICHEVAHFVLDHQLVNINKKALKQKRAEFWASFATGIVAVAESVAASQSNYYYTTGAATMATAEIASNIVTSVVERFGINYAREQEDEADKYSVNLMKLLNYNPNALSTALANARNHQKNVDRYYFDPIEFDHPPIDDRIIKNGKQEVLFDRFYKQMSSFAVTCSALFEFQKRNFLNAFEFAKQNIDNHVASDDDFVICSASLQILDNSDQSNNESMEYLNNAEKLNPININIYKYKAILFLRMKKKDDALNCLLTYNKNINEELSRLESIKSEDVWKRNYLYLISEVSWTRNMIIKTKNIDFN